jgi:hypothetical protein
MIYDKLGKAALRFAISYMRRRYRREIRIGAGVAAAVVGIAIYWANRDVPEG